MAGAVTLLDKYGTGRQIYFDASGNLVQNTSGVESLIPIYSEGARHTTEKTIATTGNTDAYVLAPFAGTLTGVDFSGVDALTADNTNYITFSITNLGQAGAGSTVMLAATDANTTKATGGTALAANTKRSLTVNATAANLVVAKGDRLRVRFAATGTLANTVTFAVAQLYFTRTS